MSTINLVFPHQLFQESPLLENNFSYYLVESDLFFNQYNFHQQKIAFHRASMLFYQDFLKAKGKTTIYIEATSSLSDVRLLVTHFKAIGVKTIQYIDPTDNWLEKRLQQATQQEKIDLIKYDSPLFLNNWEEIKPFFKKSKKKYFQTKFYIDQRKKRQLLLNPSNTPIGGKWSFDTENRKKYPKNKIPPTVIFPSENKYHVEAKKYVNNHFSKNIGSLKKYPLYPVDYSASILWLEQFLQQRFYDFGTYEDAIVNNELILNHSVLTPMLNVGLLTPKYILETSLNYGLQNDIPINSIEGFVRQIIGWREFIRGLYHCKGTQQRTTNFWNFKRKIPSSFYTATTGILPIDSTIKKILQTGYCHHIERLMILGNFMVLCEFDPDEVYRWFMELFIDAYDWVMVPNVYGMSQFADGGLMSTKPYISGSNYIKKMSNFSKGTWQEIWDGLFWRFMHKHRNFFLSNPRLGMLIRTFDKMPKEKQDNHLKIANAYLSKMN